ncbi:MAG TPA: hypothetical protein VF219_17785 [Vicinamibacterales bacterium]
MREILTSATVALLVAGASAVTAPRQQPTVRPGDIPRPDVWVTNRGNSEAIPVDLREANLGQPLAIHVLNGERNSSIPPVRVTSAQTTWEYRTVVVRPDDQLARTMNGPGAEGWETTGVAWPGADGGTMLLLKRPR